MLTIEHISSGYNKKQVIFDVSFNVELGGMVLLVGSNGSGKSTLLKTIYSLLPVWNAGKITFNDENITGLHTSKLLEKGLLYVPQKGNLFDDLTVKENLEMAGLIINKKALKIRIEQTLEAFPSLLPHLRKLPSKMSGGERQLLSLAMATLHKPKMILLDEPFNGLSPQNITFISQQIETLNKNHGVSFLIVEHRVKEASTIVQRIIGLKLGKVFNILEVNSGFNTTELHSIFM